MPIIFKNTTNVYGKRLATMLSLENNININHYRQIFKLNAQKKMVRFKKSQTKLSMTQSSKTLSNNELSDDKDIHNIKDDEYFTQKPNN